jgi:hypothetical protein
VNKLKKVTIFISDFKIPVRVIRGSDLESPYAPKSGYRYDGLYWVTDYWREYIQSAYVYKFKLVQADQSIEIPKQMNWRPVEKKVKMSREAYLHMSNYKKNSKFERIKEGDEGKKSRRKIKVEEDEGIEIEIDPSTMPMIDLKKRNEMIDLKLDPWIDQYLLNPLGIKSKNRISDVDNIVSLRKIQTVCSLKQPNPYGVDLNADNVAVSLLRRRNEILYRNLNSQELNVAIQRSELNQLRIRKAVNKLNAIVSEENDKSEEMNLNHEIEYFWP